ncbi:beta-ketoacyl-ACP synthase [Thaumasiovibrio sp. DFM-14]|uniref:beta-ketoacyl-ACP synthase n=1 Tax=Thaumasiovibrio sp. DFM-14 TaxID=3384792 RepID=UPI0039A339FB
MTYINAIALHCALGRTAESVWKNIESGEAPGVQTWHSPLFSGREATVFACEGNYPAVGNDKVADNRNNRLAGCLVAEIKPTIDEMINRFGKHRIGVVVGSTTTGISETEIAFANRDADGALDANYNFAHQSMGDVAETVRLLAGVFGPSYTLSTACTSSTRSFISAATLIESGICDAVICGGVDTLCQLTVNGFDSLEQVSDQVCRPFDVKRRGINIGEGGALFVVSKVPANVALTGWGESADAHHLSSPLPCGSGALAAMEMALSQAQLTADDVGYVNAHGTATQLNDAMEAKAIAALFGDKVSVSSTKALTGHCLGAAGAVEAALCCQLLDTPRRMLPPQWPNDHTYDPAITSIRLVKSAESLCKPAVVCNSFAFGGNNASLVFERIV